jgi:hypothetical protein
MQSLRGREIAAIARHPQPAQSPPCVTNQRSRPILLHFPRTPAASAIAPAFAHSTAATTTMTSQRLRPRSAPTERHASGHRPAKAPPPSASSDRASDASGPCRWNGILFHWNAGTVDACTGDEHFNPVSPCLSVTDQC